MSMDARPLYTSLSSNPYNEDEVQGLIRLKEPRPCVICNRSSYHAYLHKIHNGYKIATLPVCSESCTFDVGCI